MMSAPIVPKKPMPSVDMTDPAARLSANAITGDAMNASGMPAVPPEMANSIKSKLSANKKSLPGVGFKAPSSTAKKASSSVKKAHKKMKGKK